jgi:hypothetical protein
MPLAGSIRPSIPDSIDLLRDCASTLYAMTADIEDQCTANCNWIHANMKAKALVLNQEQKLKRMRQSIRLRCQPRGAHGNQRRANSVRQA